MASVGPLGARLRELSDPYLQRSAEEQAQAFTAMEEAVAQCMREKGFAYKPRVFTAQDVLAEDGPAAGSKEFAERYGYGIVDSWIEALTQTDKHLDGGQSPDPMADPLSPESVAYNEAMLGPDLNGFGGCEELRMIKPGEKYLRFMELYAEELQDLEARIASDPELVEAESNRSRCRSEQGLSDDPFNEVARMLVPIVSGVDVTTLAAPRREELLRQLQELRATEIAIATADSECSPAYDSVEREVRSRHERDFMDRPAVAALLLDDSSR